jgi:hypothetical protein
MPSFDTAPQTARSGWSWILIQTGAYNGGRNNARAAGGEIVIPDLVLVALRSPDWPNATVSVAVSVSRSMTVQVRNADTTLLPWPFSENGT